MFNDFATMCDSCCEFAIGIILSISCKLGRHAWTVRVTVVVSVLLAQLHVKLNTLTVSVSLNLSFETAFFLLLLIGEVTAFMPVLAVQLGLLKKICSCTYIPHTRYTMELQLRSSVLAGIS